MFGTWAECLERLEKNEIEKENLAKQLMQSQKMEALGTMAGGIAHDFNNILMPIMGYTELTLSNLPPGAKDRDDLQQVIRASHRAKDLIKQILTFSRQDENEKRPIEVNPLVKETVKLLRASFPSTIEFQEIIDAVDLVVTDMTMPKLTGAELAQKIMGIKPELPIVLCTGFSESINDKKAKELGIRAFIMKPVVMNDLATTVRRLLDERESFQHAAV